MIAPDDVQTEGIGSPQAVWLGKPDSRTNVWADSAGDVLVEAWHPFSRLAPTQAREYAARVLAAVEWLEQQQRLFDSCDLCISRCVGACEVEIPGSDETVVNTILAAPGV